MVRFALVGIVALGASMFAFAKGGVSAATPDANQLHLVVAKEKMPQPVALDKCTLQIVQCTIAIK